MNGVNGFHATASENSLGRDVHVNAQVNPDRNPTTVYINNRSRKKRNTKKNILVIGTWNVRTLNQPGKLENLKLEAKRLKANILGVCEHRKTGADVIADEDYTFIYSGGEKHEFGVGVLLGRKLANSLLGHWAISDRVILVKLSGNPMNINVIQVYAPTSAATDEEIERFYEQVESAKKQCKAHEVTIIMGDLNAKVGNATFGRVVGSCGLGERNERGEMWAEWCENNDQVVMNTWFKQHPRNLWTWRSPGDVTRNQIDYITVNSRFRNAVKQIKTFPGADIYSDHVPVIMKCQVKLKKIVKKKLEPKREMSVLKKNTELREKYQIEVRNRYEALEEEDLDGEENEIDKRWRMLETALVETAEKLVPAIEKKKKQKWMTDEILGMMEERRKAKGTSEYEVLDQRIKGKCKQAKEEWIDNICREIDEMSRNNSPKVYEKIKEIAGKKQTNRGNTIRMKNGDIAMDIEDVLKRWEEYIKDLFDDDRGEKPVINKEMEGPPIMKDEIRRALKKMKNGKSPGNDQIRIEMLEAMEEFAVDKVTELANKVYDTGYIPKEMRRSTFIALPKKPATVECSQHRTISLMSIITKAILSVLLERVRNKLQSEIAEVQYGFGKGKGTRNAIFVLRMIAERQIEMRKDLYLCFIDYEKAFDRVRHPLVVKMLEDVNLDGKDLRLICNLYWDQESAIRIGDNLSELINIMRGVRQGCVLSPDLFALYGERILRSIEDMNGISFGGVKLNNLRYVDDSVLMAESEEELQELLDVVNEAGEEWGLRINVDKTKSMVVTKTVKQTCNLKLAGRDKEIKQVSNFNYLGSLFTEDARCITEIKRRIQIAKKTFIDMSNLFTNIKISLQFRKKALKTFILSILLYGCEAWTITKESRAKLEACEMWFLRRMLRVPWTAMMSNEAVLEKANESRSLLNTIYQRQLKFLGHARRQRNTEDLVLTGKVNGSRGRGRPRKTYLDNFSHLGDGYKPMELLRSCDDREVFRSLSATSKDTLRR